MRTRAVHNMAAPKKAVNTDSQSNKTSDDLRYPRPRPMPPPPGRTPRRAPPPVPIRRSQPDYTPMYRTPYSNYGSGMFSSMYNYNTPYSYNRHPLSSFVRLAEDSSRPAFESMENIVQAFGSIAMVLESTYFAVQSSFRAVLGLADHFSRLRVQMTTMISTFTLFRTLRYLYRKLMVLLRMRTAEVNEAEDLWSDLAREDGLLSDKSSSRRRKSSWPLLLFFCIVIGGPYLIWRLVGSMNDVKGDEWTSGDGEHFVAVVDYDYDAENEDEITINAGQEIRVAPRDMQPHIKGWLLACADGEKSGLIPANYVRVRGKRQGRIARKTGRAVTSQKCDSHGQVWSEVCQRAGSDSDRNEESRKRDKFPESESSSANESEVCTPPPSADSALGSDPKDT